MVISRFLLPLLLLLTFNLQAQSTDSIIGKWKFEAIYNTGKIDSTGRELLKGFFGNTTLYLKSNRHYAAFLMQKEEGTWSYDSISQQLILTANKGTENHVGFKLVSGETALLSLGKDKSIVLTRDTPTAADEAEEKINPAMLMAASPAQLARKWYLHSRVVPGRSAEATAKMTDLFAGTYFQFKADGSYDVHMLSINETGKWQLQNENKTLVLTIGNEKKIWNIKSISANELVLLKGNTEEAWTFSTAEK